MTSKPKPPFAEVRAAVYAAGSPPQDYTGHQAACSACGWLGPVFTEGHRDYAQHYADLHACAAPWQPAVEAREANIVAALRGLLTAYDVRRAPKGAVDFAADGDGAGAAWSAALAAPEGTGPDVVAELRAQVAKLKAEGPWMVLHDLAEEGGLASERAAEVMEALGLRSKFIPLHKREEAVRASGDSDLIADLLRRGYDIASLRTQLRERERSERRYDAAFCPHCNNLPYVGPNGANYACPECGAYRPAVSWVDRTT